MMRRKMSRGESRRTFVKGASPHPKNLQQAPQRGGWRL